LDSIVHDNLSGYFLEMNACVGGCLGGPALRMMNISFLKSKDVLIQNVKLRNEAPPALTEGVTAEFEKKFHIRSGKKITIDEKDIQEVLAATGKTSPDKELNCGCCGYNTCREKAIAVLQGKADIHMCIPYMRELAESMSNAVVENSPIGILIVNASLTLEQFNPSAMKLLNLNEKSIGQLIQHILPSADFEKVLKSGKNVLNHKQSYKNLGLIVRQTIVLVKNSNLLFVLLEDITQEEQMRVSRQRATEETAAFANEAIGRQMRAVQEIANLLGETTSETEVALRQLTKNLIPQAGDGNGRSN
jgi:uncharacterized Fe-S cluster-containing protein